MSYARVSLKCKRLKDGDLSQFVTNVVAKTDGVATFFPIQGQIDAELKPALANYDALLLLAATGNITYKANKELAEVTLCDALTVIADGVNMIAKGDPAIILLAGFKVMPKGQRYQGDIGPMEDFGVTLTDAPGEARCTWKRVPYADKYALEYRPVGVTEWKNGTYSSSRKGTIRNIPGPGPFEIRACALGSMGRMAPWSNPITIFVI